MNQTAVDLASHSPWTNTREGEHSVQFYEGDTYLLASLTTFVIEGLRAGDAVVVVGTAAHREALLAAVGAEGLDIAAAAASGRYVSLDAADLLSTFMVNGSPDRERFLLTVGSVVAAAAQAGPRVRIYGEMVALLWAAGNQTAAIKLEELWNELRHTHAFSLLCGYHVNAVEAEGQAFRDMCAQHSRLIPAESYAATESADERLRAIVVLQEKAHALEAEIAERKAAEERFRFLAESVPQKMFTARPTGEIDYCNAQWSEFTGIDCSELKDWGWTQVIHPADVEENVRQWRHCVSTGESFQGEHRFRRADGAYRWHLTRAHAMRDAAGHVLMWVGSHTDIDDQKRREGVLARSIRQRDEFLSAISHDLKTPLTVLRGQAQILQRRIQRGALDKDVMIRGLEQIECRSRTMAKLVDELLDITRLRAGEEFHLDRAMIDLVALVQETVAEGAGVSDRHRLVVQSTEHELIGYWDAAHLQRAVENLVNNAIKYSPHGGDITISLATSSAGGVDHALLTVEDHGIGIAADDLPQIFEQFYRGKNAREGTIGTGLGLAGVRRIVEQHGGTIAVTSLEGVGSTFTVRLPLQPVREP